MATDKEIRDLAASRGFRARKFERGTEGDWSLSKTIVFDLTLTDEEVLDLLEKLKNPKNCQIVIMEQSVHGHFELISKLEEKMKLTLFMIGDGFLR